MATSGTYPVAVRQAMLAELSEALGVSISEVRQALRRLAKQLDRRVPGSRAGKGGLAKRRSRGEPGPAPAMEVLDDSSRVQLALEKCFHEAVAQVGQSEQLPPLTQKQAQSCLS